MRIAEKRRSALCLELSGVLEKHSRAPQSVDDLRRELGLWLGTLIATRFFTANLEKTYGTWVKTDRNAALRALQLIEAVMRYPFAGPGKPEPLKYVLVGCWSRRITQEHRLVYQARETRIDFLQARYHY